MEWLELWLPISCIFWGASLIWWGIQCVRCKKNKISPHFILIGGAALSAFFWFLPVYANVDSEFKVTGAITSSVLATIKIFAADGIKDAIERYPRAITGFHRIWGFVLSLWAPFLTFTFILTFFRSAVTRIRYFFSERETHIFSELNEASLAMARNIRSKDKETKKRSIIAFADIIDKNEEQHLDLVDGAKQINAILFRNDLEAIKWLLSIVRKNLSFYLLSSDEAEKIRHAKDIVKRYNKPRHRLYIFGNGEESKLLLNSYNKREESIHIKISRIDDVKLLSYSYLYNHGKELFTNISQNGELKTVNATIIGFGQYGIEMFKSLLWFCQMPGYKINLTIIDRDENLRSRFEAMFPEIKPGQDFTAPSDMRYRVDILHGALGESEFIEHVKNLPERSNIFVFLGNDERNMLAVNAISCARFPHHTELDKLTTVIYNTDLKELIDTDIKLLDVLNSFYASNEFDIEGFIQKGLTEHTLIWNNDVHILSIGFGEKEKKAFYEVKSYCESKNYNVTPCIFAENDRIDTEEVKKPNYFNICFNRNAAKMLKEKNIPILAEYGRLKLNSYIKKWDKARMESIRNAYHLSDYNFYSSLSKALHRKLRENMKDNYSGIYRDVLIKTGTTESAAEYIKFILKLKDEEKTPQILAELQAVAEIEHARWNAYMRTEGYINKSVKEINYKTHDKIIPVSDELTFEDRLKDI